MIGRHTGDTVSVYNLRPLILKDFLEAEIKGGGANSFAHAHNNSIFMNFEL